MTKSILYIARHGKTMFNTIGRAQGWSDTPLTAEGEAGIHDLGRGFKGLGINFKAAFSSDSGRTLQTMGIILDELGQPKIPYLRDKRLREWCFGSLDGGYDGELFGGVLPRTAAFKEVNGDFTKVSFEALAKSIQEVDTAGWAEDWATIRERIWTGFEDIGHFLEKNGGGNALVVSHGMTISTLIKLIDDTQPNVQNLDNGSVTKVEYSAENGFSLLAIGDMTYRQLGAETLTD
ncbi:MAG: phosphoglycerate mutase family protein [Streptococcaceae bacterium]|jgi:probable phosphoglycerate mutase|nr:phosphoglycerate mutase family protein [Streptococcaceae bacterium]